MATHILKAWPEYFLAVSSGQKKHEIRKSDRGFRTGDMIILREFDPEVSAYTGWFCTIIISYISQSDKWGIPEDIVVFSFERLDNVQWQDPVSTFGDK